MNPGFFEFISQLSNLEKTRNFNVFAEYSLEPFTKLIKKYKLNQRNDSTQCRIGVIGTNAKGSITHFLGEYFRLSGFKTGLYTSPHLLSPQERIRIGTSSMQFRNITENELNELLSEWISLGAESDFKSFSFFELFTCAAFSFFEKEGIEIQIYEAGLGGRLDATKLAEPDIVILGSIGLDHKEILGDTKEEILREKLGICSHHTKIIYAIRPKEKALEDRILQWSFENQIPCVLFSEKPEDGDYLIRNKNFCYQVFQKILNLESVFNETKINRILAFSEYEPKISFPSGRLSVLKESPLVIFDPAHNPEAFLETLKSLQSLYPKIRFQVLAGILRDKDGDSILKILRMEKQRGSIFNFSILRDSGFSLPQNCNKNESIGLNELSQFLKSDSLEPTLVLGSFRLYPIVLQAI
ncbi:Mur ligase family protein [Leptospira sp. WS92.C1]